MIAERMIKVPGAIAAFALAMSMVLTSALPSTAADSDLYIEYSGGMTWLPNQRLVEADASPPPIEGRVDSSFGFNVGASFGKRLHELFRGELQLSYRQNEVDRMPIKGQRRSAEGYVGLLAIMANGYVDYDLGIGIIPYIGAGIGWGQLRVDAKNRSTFDGPLQTSVEGEDSVFTYAVMVGGSVPLTEALDLSLGYRYIATTDGDVNSTVRNIGEGVDVVPSDPTVRFAKRLEAEFDAHEAVVGIRFKF